MTFAMCAAQAARVLQAAGIAGVDSRRDATLLARAVIGWDAARWLAHQTDEAPDGFRRRFDALTRRRAAREPVAHLLGVREFYGRDFEVSPAVLVPRPESEALVDAALDTLARARESDASRATPIILDIGTGSGCLAITLALESSSSRVIATDVSAAALDVARRNADRHRVANRIEFRAGDLTAGVAGPVTMVVANPPYVALRDRASLLPEVAEFEPAIALFGGLDGLDVIRRLVPDAARLLARDGWLIMEIGARQSAAVRGLIEATPDLSLVDIRADLQGIPRVVLARRA